MRVVKVLAVTLVVVVLVAVVGGFGAVAWITDRAMPQTTGTLQVAGLDAAVTVDRDAYGIANITRDHDPRPVLGAGLRPRRGADVADGGLAPDLGRSAVGGVRRGLARRGPLHPDARLAWRRGTGSCRALARPRARSSTLTPPGSTPGSTRIAASSASPSRHRRRARAVDRPRHAGLGQGPGLEPRRQHGDRDLPDARGRAARRSGADRRALPPPRGMGRSSSPSAGRAGGAGAPRTPRSALAAGGRRPARR